MRMAFRSGSLLALALFASVGCVSKRTHEKTLNELDEARNELRNREDIASGALSSKSSLEAEASRLRGETDSLRNANTQSQIELERLRRELEDAKARMAKANENTGIPGIDVSARDGMIVYGMRDSVLFDSGRAEIKPAGKKTLSDLAKVLKQTNGKLQIAGHTDTDPVTKTKDKYPLGNIQLGVARALAVWEALKNEGIPAARMHVASYGEHDPLEAGNKAKNRRVEVKEAQS